MKKRTPQVNDLIATIYEKNRLAIVTSVRWLPIVHDYGLTFTFLDNNQQGMQPLKNVNIL